MIHRASFLMHFDGYSRQVTAADLELRRGMHRAEVAGINSDDWSRLLEATKRVGEQNSVVLNEELEGSWRAAIYPKSMADRVGGMRLVEYNGCVIQIWPKVQ